MTRFIRRLLWKTAVYVGLPAVLFAGAYGWWAKSRLEVKLTPDGVKSYSIVSFRIVDPKESKVETSFSRVVRLAVKRKDAPNWRPSDFGLVHGVYDWAPSGTWIEVEPTLDEQKEALKLRTLEVQTPGQHIDSLSDKNPHVREIASALLRSRTGQDFGYRPDRSPETQKDAIEKWRAWWEANKLSWTAGKVLEGVGEILKR